MQKNVQEVFLWQDVLIVPLLSELKVAEGTAEYCSFKETKSMINNNDYCASGLPIFSPIYPGYMSTNCFSCKLDFDSWKQLKQHYAEESHKMTVIRSVEGLQPLACQQYASSNHDEDEEENEQFRRTPKIYFKNVDGVYLSIYKSLLLPPKTNGTEQELITKAQYCHKRLYWVVILISSGKFAAAVFQGTNVVVHKAFHSYTSRSSQGGSQSSHDNGKNGRGAQSAGANLRRELEKTFVLQVRAVLSEWKEHLEKCNLIFCRSSSNCRNIVFGGSSPILKKVDLRIRSIPFPTRRPTFMEIKRVHCELTKVMLYDLDEFNIESNRNKIITQKHLVVKKNGKDMPEQNLPVVAEEVSDEYSDEYSEVDSEDLEQELICEKEELTFTDLQEFGYVQTIFTEKEDKLEVAEKCQLSLVKNMVNDACAKSNLQLLKAIQKCYTSGIVEDIIPKCARKILLEHPRNFDIKQMLFGPDKKTILHLAVLISKMNVIWWLLERGCDPAIADWKDRMPCSITNNIGVQSTFRRFMSDYPDKFDYKKAKIPSALTKEELDEKKNSVKQKKESAKKLKLLKVKEVQKVKEDKFRYAKLPDREKRAMAAEKRIIAERGNMFSITRQLCNFCNVDITTKVPFSFNNNNFCSTTCVSKQRKKDKCKS